MLSVLTTGQFHRPIKMHDADGKLFAVIYTHVKDTISLGSI